MNRPSLPRSTRVLKTAATFGILLSLACHASRADRALTLDEAIAIGLEQNLSLKRAATTVDLRKNDVDSADAADQANLTLSASPGARYARQGITNGRDLSDSLGTTLSSSISLYDGQGIQADQERAELNLSAAGRDQSRARQSVLYDTVNRFMTAVLRGKQVAIQEQDLATREQQLERIDFDFQNGIRVQADVLRQRALVAESQRRLILAKQTHQTALLSLKRSLQIPSLEPLDCQDPPESLLAAVELPSATVDHWIEQALQRPDILAQQDRLAAAEQGIRAARSGMKPTVSASASVRTSYASQSAAGFDNQYFDENPELSVGLSVSVPIFDRRRTKTDTVRARLQLQQEEYAYQDITHSLAIDLQQILLDYRTAEAALEASRIQLESAEEALRAIQELYRVDAVTILELSDLQTQRLNAAVNLVDARYQLYLSRLGIAFQSGEIETFLNR